MCDDMNIDKCIIKIVKMYILVLGIYIKDNRLSSHSDHFWPF